MEEKADGTDRDGTELSVEEFDALEGIHEFSEKYTRNKKRMLKKYRSSVCRPGPGGWGKAAAGLLLFLSAPVIVSAASGSGFFYRAWGTLGKENVESHEEIVYDEDKGTSCTVTYPQREYTDEGLGRAEELVGGAVSYYPLVREIGDTKLTVLAAAYDGNAAVVEFTLEREGGVEGLIYGQLYNESKGAWFSEDAPFCITFADSAENIWVDLDKSTEELLYCCGYLVTGLGGQVSQGLTMEIYENPADGEDREIQAQSLFIPIEKRIEKKEYESPGGGTVSISPMSMDIDCNRGLGLTQEQIYDPWHIYYAAVNYKDGSSYIVHEHGIEGIHACGTDIENTGYACGTQEGHLVFVFNRLVDVGNVESVVVNETEYTLKQR